MKLFKIGALTLVGMMALNSCGSGMTEEEANKKAEEMAAEVMKDLNKDDPKYAETVDVPEMATLLESIQGASDDEALYAQLDPYLASEAVKEGMGYMMFEDESEFEITKHRGQVYTIRIGGDENNEIDVFWEKGKIVDIKINMEIE